MKHLDRVALCLLAVAMLILTVSGVAQASSLEWGKCATTEGGSGGRYIDSGCTQKATKHKGEFTGGYEWTQLEGEDESVEGTVQMSGEFSMETAAGKRVSCETVRKPTSLYLSGPNGAGVPRWQFSNCSSEGQECGTQFEGEGEINSIFEQELANEGEGWSSRLGYVSGKGGTEPVVGMEYTPYERQRLLAPIVCAGPIGTVWIGGAPKGPNTLVSVISPVNHVTSTFEETFSQGAVGHNAPERFQGRRKAGLEAFLENRWEPVSLTVDLSFEVEAPVELKATK